MGTWSDHFIDAGPWFSDLGLVLICFGVCTVSLLLILHDFAILNILEHTLTNITVPSLLLEELTRPTAMRPLKRRALPRPKNTKALMMGLFRGNQGHRLCLHVFADVGRTSTPPEASIK